MPTKDDIEQAIILVGNLREVAKGFGISVNALKVQMDAFGIIPEKLKPVEIPKTEKPKPYVHETDENGVRCTSDWYGCKNYAEKCFYGGKFGGMTCCDYYLITGNRRPIADKLDTCYCTAYFPISKKEKTRMKLRKTYEEKRQLLQKLIEERGKDYEDQNR
jgi:hypothetical protein